MDRRAQLGNVSPVIVVTGEWPERDLAYHAENVVTMLTNNGAFNCNAARVLVRAMTLFRDRVAPERALPCQGHRCLPSCQSQGDNSVKYSSILSLLLAIAPALYGQCNPVPGTQPAMSTMNSRLYVAYTLTGVAGCNPSSAMGMNSGNGAYCFGAFVVPPNSYNCPAGTMNCSGLLARIQLTGPMGVPTMAGAHSCQWTGCCGTQTFTINQSNGLPVELMDFEISTEERESAGDRDAEQHFE